VIEVDYIKIRTTQGAENSKNQLTNIRNLFVDTEDATEGEKGIIADILDKRIEKITYATLVTVRGGKPNLEYATTKELELYDAIVKELKEGRCAVLL